jgi:Subtilase family
VRLSRATLTRLLLAVALATATAVHDTDAQTFCDGQCPIRPTQPGPGPQTPGSGGSDSSNRGGLFILGGVLAIVAGWAIWTQFFRDPPGGGPATLPPSQPPITPVQITPPAPPAGPIGPTVQALRNGFNLPAVGAACMPNHVILDIPSTVNQATLDAIALRHAMTRLESFTLRLTGRTLHLWRIDSSSTPTDMLRTFNSERLIAGGQCDHIYLPAQAESEPVNADQYAPQKLKLVDAHRLARGGRVLIAVIDSEVDATHPDIAGSIAGNFGASADDERPHSHGTGMAGAIVARRAMLGVAPEASLLTVRAFSSRANTVEGTTFNILKGLDWAAEKGARVVNMSFAGPSDPRLREALGKAYKKGMVLIAAAGNAGPNSPPLFPAADPNVIAVTATDSNDALFTGANRGNHIAVAAPGVDVLAPAPDGTYQFTTGTSVAAAEVSGAAALLIQRNPAITPAQVRKILMDTAKDLGPKGRDPQFGAGLIDVLRAVNAAKPR